MKNINWIKTLLSITGLIMLILMGIIICSMVDCYVTVQGTGLFLAIFALAVGIYFLNLSNLR
jgi:hypothetical protein